MNLIVAIDRVQAQFAMSLVLADGLRALRRLGPPCMIFRRADFAGWRVNWRDLAELAAELNLGLVNIDDNPGGR